MKLFDENKYSRRVLKLWYFWFEQREGVFKDLDDFSDFNPTKRGAFKANPKQKRQFNPITGGVENIR